MLSELHVSSCSRPASRMTRTQANDTEGLEREIGLNVKKLVGGVRI
jgi:hypothetical protein